ncbi:MAG TPA: 7-carboxy-7-deazaguanine synthase QueE [Fimbriimonadaceae bacterium]|nr:7-carboxy-7-deazaguanine synthase QueE [Fimbriimonadaceae bacterium]
MKLKIAETFLSIQGEGIWSGVPSYFIRISGCNLRCVWCDTPYASWNPVGELRTVESLIAEVLHSNTKHVVITGGEPMLFDPIVDLAQGLRLGGKVITIETAGTVFRELACDLMSISPKLANSTPPTESGWQTRHETTRLDREPLKKLLGGYNSQLKFVVDPDKPGDVEEISELLATLPDCENILIMPEGTDSETLHRRMRALAPICIERGWRLCPRLHVDLFGNTPGT